MVEVMKDYVINTFEVEFTSLLDNDQINEDLFYYLRDYCEQLREDIALTETPVIHRPRVSQEYKKAAIATAETERGVNDTHWILCPHCHNAYARSYLRRHIRDTEVCREAEREQQRIKNAALADAARRTTQAIEDTRTAFQPTQRNP